MKKVKYLVLVMLVMVVFGVGCGCGSESSEDVIDMIEDLEDAYTIDTFPYFNKRESKKLVKFYNEIIEGDYKNYTFVKEDKGYKATSYISEYLYVGEMKDNRPNGKGAIFSPTLGYGYILRYLGNFEEGKLEGYALSFDWGWSGVLSLEYEGEWSENERSGSGILYQIVESGKYYDCDVYENIEALEIYDVSISVGMVVGADGIYYVGEFKDNEFDGKGSVYVGESLIYEGELKDGLYHGEGILYFEDGKDIKYKGEFKEGKYHGKGTLYDDDGSVKYKGKFKNGDYE